MREFGFDPNVWQESTRDKERWHDLLDSRIQSFTDGRWMWMQREEQLKRRAVTQANITTHSQMLDRLQVVSPRSRYFAVLVKYFEEGLLTLDDDMENTLDLASFLTTDDGPDEFTFLEEVGSHVADPERTVRSAHSPERMHALPNGKLSASLVDEEEDGASLTDEGDDSASSVHAEGVGVAAVAWTGAFGVVPSVGRLTPVGLGGCPRHLDSLLNPKPFENYARAGLPVFLPSQQPAKPVDMVARLGRVRRATQSVRERLAGEAVAAGVPPPVGAAVAPGQVLAQTFLDDLAPSIQQIMRHPKRPRGSAQVPVQVRRSLSKPGPRQPVTEVAEAQMVAYGSGKKRSRVPVLQVASFPQASMARDARHGALHNQRRPPSWKSATGPGGPSQSSTGFWRAWRMVMWSGRPLVKLGWERMQTGVAGLMGQLAGAGQRGRGRTVVGGRLLVVVAVSVGWTIWVAAAVDGRLLVTRARILALARCVWVLRAAMT